MAELIKKFTTVMGENKQQVRVKEPNTYDGTRDALLIDGWVRSVERFVNFQGWNAERSCLFGYNGGWGWGWKQLANTIFPIFDQYPLLTTKYFNYAKFKEAYYILEDSKLTKSERNASIETLLLTKPSESYISPAWNKITLPIADANEASKVISKSWLIGFVEAEGSFYLVTKDANRIVHGFGITQKLDRVVLEGIRHILHISTKVVYKEKYNHHMIDTTNSRAIKNVSKYFFNTMKGMKGVEYRIWSRSFNKHKGDYSQLVKIQKLLRELRTVRADNTLWTSKS
ncbi:hypothetical protein HPULCUR_011581 [Helicostylum pulchrum]|uniref:Homing endonuclease LAGLIDADG domain-containing protein n=1 Tax=Helicostylum pulchrum TaxID=562976 RepID=A0ABP9YGG7_9FUNG